MGQYLAVGLRLKASVRKENNLIANRLGRFSVK